MMENAEWESKPPPPGKKKKDTKEELKPINSKEKYKTLRKQ